MSSAFCPGLSVEKECLWTKLCLSFSASPRPLNFDPLSAWALCNPSLTAPPRVGWRRGTDPLIYCPITATPTHSFPHPTSAHAALSCFVLFFFCCCCCCLVHSSLYKKSCFLPNFWGIRRVHGCSVFPNAIVFLPYPNTPFPSLATVLLHKRLSLVKSWMFFLWHSLE